MFGISYWILPLFAGTVWLGMYKRGSYRWELAVNSFPGTLLGMLGYWLAAGSPHYVEMGANQHIAYISDIGATFLKPLFITGSVTMVVVFDLTFIAERWLRHKNRLTPNYSRREAFLNVCAIIAAIIGAVGLIVLTVYDIKHHKHVHDACLGVFMYVAGTSWYSPETDSILSIGYIVSAIFICAEYQRLGIHFREYRVLRISFWIKLAFILIEVGLAIGYGVTNKQGAYNVSAILEWVVALIYIFFVWYV